MKEIILGLTDGTFNGLRLTMVYGSPSVTLVE
jgi:hypothetical protein